MCIVALGRMDFAMERYSYSLFLLSSDPPLPLPLRERERCNSHCYVPLPDDGWGLRVNGNSSLNCLSVSISVNPYCHAVNIPIVTACYFDLLSYHVYIFPCPLQGKILYANEDTFDGVFHSGHVEGKGTLTCRHTDFYFTGNFKNSLVCLIVIIDII